MDYTYDYDEGWEGSISSRKANKVVRELYVTEIISWLDKYEVFSGGNCKVFSIKLWAEIRKQFKEPDDELLDYLEKAIKQLDKLLLKFTVKDSFKAYHTILKVTRKLITNKDADTVEEGEYI